MDSFVAVRYLIRIAFGLELFQSQFPRIKLRQNNSGFQACEKRQENQGRDKARTLGYLAQRLSRGPDNTEQLCNRFHELAL